MPNEVTQADIEAANKWCDEDSDVIATCDEIDAIAKAFAAHRLSAQPAPVGDGVEALLKAAKKSLLEMEAELGDAAQALTAMQAERDEARAELEATREAAEDAGYFERKAEGGASNDPAQ